MSNDLIAKTMDAANLPAGLQDFFKSEFENDDLSSNISGGGFPVVSIKGSKFAVRSGGESYPVVDSEGMQSSYIDVIILKSSPFISKAYYDKKYTEGDDAAPDCSSSNGTTPDASIPNPCHHECATCPNNEWGSRITENGSNAKACQDSKRIAVLLVSRHPAEVEFGPMLLKIPATSLKTFGTYGKMLKQRGAVPQLVVTRLSFEQDAAYPKIEAKALQPITAEQGEALLDIVNTRGDVIEDILSKVAEPAKAVEKAVEEQKVVEEPAAEEVPASEPKLKAVSNTKASVEDVMGELDSL